MQSIRARIGLIIPSSNQLTEPQFNHYAPEGVQVHVTRMRMTGPYHAPVAELMPRILEAGRCLADAKCDVIVFHCTAAAMEAGVEGGRRVVEVLEQVSGARATTTADAVLAAFAELNVRAITLLSPYARAAHDEEKAFLESVGIRVLRDRALEVPQSLGYPSVPAARWVELALEEDHPEAEACFLSCTNIHSLPVLDEIERRLGRPAIASNQATLWHCLRLLGIDEPIAGLGRLLARRVPA